MEKKMYFKPSTNVIYIKTKMGLLAGSNYRSLKRTEEDADDSYEVL